MFLFFITLIFTMVTSELPFEVVRLENEHPSLLPKTSTWYRCLFHYWERKGELIIVITQLGFSMPFFNCSLHWIKIKQSGRKWIQAYYSWFLFFYLNLSSHPHFPSDVVGNPWGFLHEELTKDYWWWIVSLHSARKR